MSARAVVRGHAAPLRRMLVLTRHLRSHRQATAVAASVWHGVQRVGGAELLARLPRSLQRTARACVGALGALPSARAVEAACERLVRVLPPPAALVARRTLLVVRGGAHAFNLIELLIAISIIVTFSSLVGAVYLKKLEDTKLSRAKVDINTIEQSLIMYYARNSRFPRALSELVEHGDIRSVPVDPWDNEYQYVPQLDWNLIMRSADTAGDGEASAGDLLYHVDCIRQVTRVVSALPDRLDPMLLLAASFEGAFVFSRGLRDPIFGQNVLTQPRDRVRMVARLMKATLERAGGNAKVKEAVQPLIKLCAQQRAAV